METTQLLDALDSVVWYNGLFDFIKYIEEEITKEKSDGSKCISFQLMPSCNDKIKEICENDRLTIGQCEMLWMILVELFGDYGMSPRGGWLNVNENKEEILKFLNAISKTSI